MAPIKTLQKGSTKIVTNVYTSVVGEVHVNIVIRSMQIK